MNNRGMTSVRRELRNTVRTLLATLRNGSAEYEYLISLIREDISKGGFSLTDFSTDEEELANLRTRGCALSARKFLGYLRNGTELYNEYIAAVREEASKGNFSLADIGTSEAELENLRVSGCKRVAAKKLKSMRDGLYTHPIDGEYILEKSREGCFPLADIGTSEVEIHSLTNE